MYDKLDKTFDTPVRFRNVRGSVLGTSTGFASDIIKQMSVPVRYFQEHNILRSKYDASARHPMVHAIPYIEGTVTA